MVNIWPKPGLLARVCPKGVYDCVTASEIRKALDQAPFQPFELLTGDGERYSVPTPDHAAVSPTGRITAVFHDDDSVSNLDVLLVTAVRFFPPNSAKQPDEPQKG